MDQATKQQRILSFSNQFYTIVPQNFGSHGMSDKHLIDSMENLLKKRELVETLLEMEIAVSLSKTVLSNGDSGSDANPIDLCYKKLKADIKPVDKTAREFKLVPPPCTCVQRAICSMRAESGAHN
jgi:poly [ADP-ribose] polymerase